MLLPNKLRRATSVGATARSFWDQNSVHANGKKVHTKSREIGERGCSRLQEPQARDKPALDVAPDLIKQVRELVPLTYGNGNDNEIIKVKDQLTKRNNYNMIG